MSARDIERLLDSAVVLDSYLGNGRYRGSVFFEQGHVADVELTVTRVYHKRPTKALAQTLARQMQKQGEEDGT